MRSCWRRKHLLDEVKQSFNSLLLSGQYVKLVQISPFIGEDARSLRWKHSILLKPADAVHVATALERKCEEFLTTNGRLARLSQVGKGLEKLGLRVCAGRDTSCLADSYRQIEMLDKKDNPSLQAQRRAFIETAHALGCDEDKERFEATLGKIATHKPEKVSEKSAPAKTKRGKTLKIKLRLIGAFSHCPLERGAGIDQWNGRLRALQRVFDSNDLETGIFTPAKLIEARRGRFRDHRLSWGGKCRTPLWGLSRGLVRL